MPMTGYGGQGGYNPGPMMGETLSTPAEPPKPTYTAPAKKPMGSSKAMKLGGKSKDVDSFVDQLKSEGENVMSTEMSQKQSAVTAASSIAPQINTERYTNCMHLINFLRFLNYLVTSPLCP